MEPKIGYVYVLTNPSFKEDWVKIGKSARFPDVRSKELDNTAVPLPYEVFATLKTAKFSEAEKQIHKQIKRLNPDLRIRPNREFFNIKPEDAAEILEDVAELIDGEFWCKVESDITTAKMVKPTKQVAQQKRFTCYGKGLQNGDEIKFIKDSTIIAVVCGERQVKFEGKEWKLSPLVRELFTRRDEVSSSGAYQGPLYFTFNGVRLTDLPDKSE